MKQRCGLRINHSFFQGSFKRGSSIRQPIATCHGRGENVVRTGRDEQDSETERVSRRRFQNHARHGGAENGSSSLLGAKDSAAGATREEREHSLDAGRQVQESHRVSAGAQKHIRLHFRRLHHEAGL